MFTLVEQLVPREKKLQKALITLMVRLLITLFFFVLFIKAEEKVKYIDNGQIKLGIDLAKGGSITYLADSNIEKN